MKISIITPSYNSVTFINKAIESVLAQNYVNFEHIIIDGASTDGTIAILQKYPHLKWISEPDDGQSDALNKGFQLATGDIIGWLNSDDFYLPNAFNKILNEFNKDIDAVYSNLKFTDNNGFFTRDYISHKPVQWLSLFHCYIPSATFFFRRNIIDDGISIENNFHICMDKEFFAHILSEGYKVKYINDFLAAFRWHKHNKSIDTTDIRKIRYKEGLITFNRYSKFTFPTNKFWICFYSSIVQILLLYRKYLRFIA